MVGLAAGLRLEGGLLGTGKEAARGPFLVKPGARWAMLEHSRASKKFDCPRKFAKKILARMGPKTPLWLKPSLFHVMP